MSNQKKMAGGVNRSPIVRCPTCKEKLKEILYVPVYRCPKCNTVFLANSWKADKGVRNLDKHAMVSHKKDVPKQVENADHASKNESIHENKEASSSPTDAKDIESKSRGKNISEKCIDKSSATLNNELMPVRKNVDVLSESTENNSSRDSPDNGSDNCEIMLGDRVMSLGMEADNLALSDEPICVRRETALCSRDMNKIESGSHQKNVSENLSTSSFSILNDESMSQKSIVDSCSKDTSEVEDNSTQDSPGNGSMNCEVERDKRMMLIGKEATPHQEKSSYGKSLRDNDSEDGEPLYFSQSEIVSCKISINETEIMSSYDNAVMNDSEACRGTLDDGLTSRNEEVPFTYKCKSTTGLENSENISILSEKNIVRSGSEDNEPTLNQEVEGPECISSQKCLPDDGSVNSQHALNGASFIASVEAACCTENVTKLDSISFESNLDHSENHESSSKEDPLVFVMRISPTISEVRGSENLSFQSNTSKELLQNGANILPEMVLDKEIVKCVPDGGDHENLVVSKNRSCKFAGNEGLVCRRMEVAPSSTHTNEPGSIQKEKYKVDSYADKEAFHSSNELEYLSENVIMGQESEGVSTQKKSPENCSGNGVTMDGEIISASIKCTDCTTSLMENKIFSSDTKQIVSANELENVDFLLADGSISLNMEASHPTNDSKGFDIVSTFSNVSVSHSDNSEHIFENKLHFISKKWDRENISVEDNQKDLLITSDGMMSVGMEAGLSSTIVNKHNDNSISSLENVAESDNEEHGVLRGTTNEAVTLQMEVSGSSIDTTNCGGILLGENITAIESEICEPSFENKLHFISKKWDRENISVEDNQKDLLITSDGMMSVGMEAGLSSTIVNKHNDNSISSLENVAESDNEEHGVLRGTTNEAVTLQMEVSGSSIDTSNCGGILLGENITAIESEICEPSFENKLHFISKKWDRENISVEDNQKDLLITSDGMMSVGMEASLSSTIVNKHNDNSISSLENVAESDNEEHGVLRGTTNEAVTLQMEVSGSSIDTSNCGGILLGENITAIESEICEPSFENKLHFISKKWDRENISVEDNQKDLLITSDGMMCVGMEAGLSSTIVNKHNDNSISSLENLAESDNEEHGVLRGTTNEAVTLQMEVSGSSIDTTNCGGILLGENITAIESEICEPSLNNELMALSKETGDISYKNTMQQIFPENGEMRIADRLISASLEDASSTTETEASLSIPAQSFTSQDALENLGSLVNEESKFYAEISPSTTKAISIPTQSGRPENFLEIHDPKLVDDFSLVRKEMGPKRNESISLKRNKPKIVKDGGMHPVSVRKNYSSSSYMRKRISSQNYMDVSILENDRPSINCESVQKTMKIAPSSTDAIKHDSLLSTSNQTENVSEHMGCLIDLEILSRNGEIEHISNQNEALNTYFGKEEHEENNELNSSRIKGVAGNSHPSTSASTENGLGKDDALADEPEPFSWKLSPSKEVMRPETVSSMSSMYVNDMETSKDTELAASRKESTALQRNSSQSVEGDQVLQIHLILEPASLYADNSTHHSIQFFDNNTGFVSVGMKSGSSLEEINDQEASLSQVIAIDNCNDESEFLSDKSFLQDMDTSIRAASKDTRNNPTWREASESTRDNSFLSCTNDVIAAEIESHSLCTAIKNDTVSPKAYVPESGQNANLLKDAMDSDSISSENTISEGSTSKDSSCLDHELMQDDVFGKVGQSINDELKCTRQEIGLVLTQNEVVEKDTGNSEFAGNDESSSLKKDIETYLFGTSIMFMATDKDASPSSILPHSEYFQGFHTIANGKSIYSVTEENDEFLNISHDGREHLGSRDQKNFPKKDMDRKVDNVGQEKVNSQHGSNDATTFSVGNSDACDQHIGRDTTGDQLSSPVRNLRSLRSLIKSESVVIKEVHKSEASTVNKNTAPQIEVLQESTRASTMPKVRRCQQIIGNHTFPPNKTYDLNTLSQVQVERGKNVNLGPLSEDRSLHEDSSNNINLEALATGLNSHEMFTGSNKISHPSEKVKFPKLLHIDVPRKVDLLRNRHIGPLEQTHGERRSSLSRQAWRRRVQTQQKSPQNGQVFLSPSSPQHPNSTSRQREVLPGNHKFNNTSETSSPHYHRRSHQHLQSSTQFQQNQRRYTKHSPLSSENMGKNGHEMQKANAQVRRQTIKLHLRPIVGGMQYIICYECLELLQVPQDFHFARKRENKLRCGACSKVLKFSLDGNHISPFIANQRLPSDG